MANFYKLTFRRTAGYIAGLMLFFCFSQSSMAAPINGALTIDKGAAASSTNFTTFQSLFTSLSTNGVNGAVTVTVLNGPYTEQVTANAISGVSATNTITIDGNGQTLQFSASSSSAAHTFRFNGADRVTIKDLTIKALGTSYSWGVHFMNASDYNTLDNCVIEITNNTSTTQNYNVGINFCNSTSSTTTLSTAAKYCVVKNCLIKGGGTTKGPYVGIMVAAQSQNVDCFITLENNAIQDFYAYGIYMYYACSVDVLNNDISRPNRTNSTTCYGINMYYYSYRNKIIGNKIHNLYTSYSTYTGTCYAIRCYYNYSGASNSIVANNAIYNIEHNGYLYAIYAYYAQGVVFTHNTVSDDMAASNSSYRYGFYVYSSTVQMAGTEFTNNVLSLTRPGGYRYAYYYYANIPKIDNNSYWVNGSGSNNYFATGTAVYNDFNSWKSGTGHDGNSEFANPYFKNISAGDFSPTVVQLDGIGTPIAAITTDINGSPRSLTDPDPGAVSFDVDANVTRLDLAGHNACQSQEEYIKVWVKNNSPNKQQDFNVQYRVNGGAPVQEPFKNTLNPGDSAQFTFVNPLTYTNSGIYAFEARIKGKPYVGPYNVTVSPAPLGAEVAKGSVFQGQFNSGSPVDPDIVANPDELNFELLPPTGYSNSDYGTKWTISKLTALTSGGAVINTSNYTTTPAGGGNLKLQFKPASGLTDSLANFALTVYSLTTNCYAPDIERSIFVAPRPVAGANTSDVCDGDAGDFTSASTISSGTMEYLWDFGDGTTSNYADNLKKYAVHGTYTVTLTATSNYGYTNTVTKTVNVYQKPDADFSAINKCAGDVIPFTDKSIVYNGGLTYEWNFGDMAGNSTAVNPTYQYATVGSYIVSLGVTDAKGCFSKITKPVTLSARPTADFTLPALSCSQADVSFTNTSIPAGNTGYVWKYGDGAYSHGSNAAHKYAAAGNYDVTIVALNEFGCSDSMVKTMAVAEGPAPAFTVSGQCIGEPVDFTNTTVEPTGTTVSYTWELNGNTSSNKDESTTFLAVGDYDVVLTALASNQCEAKTTTTLTFTEKPIPGFTIDENACTGKDVAILNSSVAGGSTLSYSWDLGNGTSTDKDPVANYATAGSYTVKLVATTGAGCSETQSKTIVITDTPNSDFTFESGKTGDGRMIFKPIAPNGAGNYIWVYGDGGVGSNKDEHPYTYLGLGIYKVTLKIIDNGCSSSTQKDLVINALGVNNPNGQGVFEVYPNPATGIFNIKLTGTENVQAVTIVSMLGQQVMAQEFAAASQDVFTFDLTTEKPGVYFVHVATDKGNYTAKLTLTR